MYYFSDLILRNSFKFEKKICPQPFPLDVSYYSDYEPYLFIFNKFFYTQLLAGTQVVEISYVILQYKHNEYNCYTCINVEQTFRAHYFAVRKTNAKIRIVIFIRANLQPNTIMQKKKKKITAYRRLSRVFRISQYARRVGFVSNTKQYKVERRRLLQWR